MGTNFYAVTDDGTVHLGKRSAGWRFGFRAHPDRGITNLRTLVGFLENTPHVVVDEYGYEHDTIEFMSMAQAWGGDWDHGGHRQTRACWCGWDASVHGRWDALTASLLADDYIDPESDTDWCAREFS